MSLDCKIPEDKFTDLYMVDLFRDWEGGIAQILRVMNIDSRKGDVNT